jgi:Polysaccharide biosynthesis enzyme WcbI
MKIGIVGNCTAPGIGMGMRQLMGDNEIWAIEAIAARRDGKLAQSADLLCGCEIVFSHRLSEEYGPLSTTALGSRCSNFHMMPATVFTGYHPDMIYIHRGGKPLGSPLGPYHSAIAAAAFSLGLDVAGASGLFNSDVFERLGYFDEFDKATDYLRRCMEDVGLDIGADWPILMCRAPFMHTINHPKAVLVGIVAKLLAAKAELVPRVTASPDLVYDALSASLVWPVYPSIGEKLGIRGNFLFKRIGGPDLTGGQGVFFGLQEFLERSFLLYASYHPDAFALPAVADVQNILRSMI